MAELVACQQELRKLKVQSHRASAAVAQTLESELIEAKKQCEMLRYELSLCNYRRVHHRK
eukprot:6059128-Pleurochrysis_carterae.AAC.3